MHLSERIGRCRRVQAEDFRRLFRPGQRMGETFTRLRFRPRGAVILPTDVGSSCPPRWLELRRGAPLERVQQKWKPVLRSNALSISSLARFPGG
jgi:hypothetical protein